MGELPSNEIVKVTDTNQGLVSKDKTNNYLSEIKNVLQQHFPEKYLAVTKAEEAIDDTEQKKQLELEKDIAKHFNATYLRHLHYVADCFHIRNTDGEFIVSKDKKILIGPAMKINVASQVHGSKYKGYISSSYFGIDKQRYLYYVDKNHNAFSLQKQKHYNTIKPVNSNNNIHIINVAGETTIIPNEHGSTHSTPYYDYLIDSKGNKLSDPYEYIDLDLVVIVNGQAVYSHNQEERDRVRHTKLIEKDGKYEELGEWFSDMHKFDNGNTLFIKGGNKEPYYHLYDKDNLLIKTMQAVRTSFSLQSPFVGKDETGYKIIYEGEIFDVSDVLGAYPVADDECRDGRDIYTLHNAVFMKNTEGKLILWKEGKFVDLKNAPKSFVHQIFHNQATVYIIDDNKVILTDKDNTIIDVGNYHIPRENNSNEKTTLLRNYYLKKEPKGERPHSLRRQIVSNTGAISAVYDIIHDTDQSDIQLIKEMGYIKVSLGEKELLIDASTCMPVTEHADKIYRFSESYIYLSRLSQKDGEENRTEAYLLDKKLNPLLGPVESIREYENMIKVHTYKTREMPSTTDGRHYIDNAIYYFPDLTLVGK